MFDKATRLHLRFETSKGSVSVEDLWDMPLTSEVGRPNLDSLAISYDKQLRETAETKSFVTPTKASIDRELLQLKFDIVHHIIGVRLKEREERAAATDRAAQKEKLLGILARKQDAELESKTADELKAAINAL